MPCFGLGFPVTLVIVMKKRYLIIITIISIIAGLVALGLNHQYVKTLAQSIILKDKSGEGTSTDITKLSDYVHSHTRSGVSFSLEGSYARAVQAAEQAAIPTANSAVYNAALASCQVKDPVKTAHCIEAYVQSHAAPGTDAKPVILPDHGAYVYQLNAPGWAPDVAGICFLVAVISIVLTFWALIVRPSKSHKF